MIDGPPVLEMTEARLLAGIVDRVLFAVQWGKTRAEIARNALQSLQRDTSSGVRIGASIWAVVTRVDIKEHARYHFGDALEFYVRRQGSKGQSPHAAAAAIKNVKERARKTVATSVQRTQRDEP